jgi:hypothetical protein
VWAAPFLHFVATLTRIPLTDSGLKHGKIQGHNEIAEDSVRNLSRPLPSAVSQARLRAS